MAASFNKALIIGNLTRDPEVRTTPTGQTVCSFGVATNRRWKDAAGQLQEETEFHSVVAWARLAEICGQYLTKGRKVFIEGRLKTHDWEGQDGVKRYRTEIIAENMVMLDRAPGANGSGPADLTAPSKTTAPVSQDEPAANPDHEIKLEDIPF